MHDLFAIMLMFGVQSRLKSSKHRMQRGRNSAQISHKNHKRMFSIKKHKKKKH